MGFFGGLVMIFDDVKSGEMLDFVGVCRSGYRSESGEKCVVCGVCENVCDVGVGHMTMILKIGIIPKM